KSLATVQGHKVATIATTGSATLNAAHVGAPGPVLIAQVPGIDMKISKMDEALDGSARFDVDRGQMICGKTNVGVRLLLRLAVPSARGHEVQANVDAQISLNVGPPPTAPPAAPAAKKKPHH